MKSNEAPTGRSLGRTEVLLVSALIVCWVGSVILPAPHRIAVVSVAWPLMLLSAIPAIGLAALLALQHAASRHLANSHYVFFFGLLFPGATLAVVGGGLQNQANLIGVAAPLALLFGPWALAHVVASVDGRPMGAVRIAALGWGVGWCLCRMVPPLASIIVAFAAVGLWQLRDELLPQRVAPSSSVGLGAYILLNVTVLLGPLVVMLSYFYGFYEQIDAVLDSTDPYRDLTLMILPDAATPENFWALVGARYAGSFLALMLMPVAVMLWPQVRLSRREQGLCAALLLVAAATGGHATVGAGAGALLLQAIALCGASVALATAVRTARWRQAYLAATIASTVALSAWQPTASSIGEAFILLLADSTWMVLLWLPAYLFAIRTLRIETSGSVA
ncbi:hypothetical protein GC173_03695 [bacterium]|nr:hypothetical protein [bacterium]